MADKYMSLLDWAVLPIATGALQRRDHYKMKYHKQNYSTVTHKEKGLK